MPIFLGHVLQPRAALGRPGRERVERGQLCPPLARRVSTFLACFKICLQLGLARVLLLKDVVVCHQFLSRCVCLQRGHASYGFPCSLPGFLRDVDGGAAGRFRVSVINSGNGVDGCTLEMRWVRAAAVASVAGGDPCHGRHRSRRSRSKSRQVPAHWRSRRKMAKKAPRLSMTRSALLESNGSNPEGEGCLPC